MYLYLPHAKQLIDTDKTPAVLTMTATEKQKITKETESNTFVACPDGTALEQTRVWLDESKTLVGVAQFQKAVKFEALEFNVGPARKFEALEFNVGPVSQGKDGGMACTVTLGQMLSEALFRKNVGKTAEDMRKMGIKIPENIPDCAEIKLDGHSRPYFSFVKLDITLPAREEFQECAECAAKPGTPDLCADCLKRRAEFYKQNP